VRKSDLLAELTDVLSALQRRRIEAAKMKLLKPLAGYTLYEHKTND